VTVEADHGLAAGSCTLATYVDGDVTAHALPSMAPLATVYLRPVPNELREFNVFGDSECKLAAIEINDGTTGEDVDAGDSFVLTGITETSTHGGGTATFKLTTDNGADTLTKIQFSAGSGYAAGDKIRLSAAALNNIANVASCVDAYEYTIRATDLGLYQNVDGAGACADCNAGQKVAVDGSDMSGVATTCIAEATCGVDKYRLSN
jgi:hypothetical protein